MTIFLWFAVGFIAAWLSTWHSVLEGVPREKFNFAETSINRLSRLFCIIIFGPISLAMVLLVGWVIIHTAHRDSSVSQTYEKIRDAFRASK